MIWFYAALVLLIVAAVSYYLLILTEGTYLGTRIVVLLYDWAALKYDRMKKLRPVYESFFLGIPLAEALREIPSPCVLDVATGTGRLPRTLSAELGERGVIVGVDRSERMLALANEEKALLGPGVYFLRADADHLCFADASFDAVTCLEALEFFTQPRRAVREMYRVLKPGGILLVSNRVGWDAWLFPGRAAGRGRLERLLRQEGFCDVSARRWQVHYDLIWACKGTPAGVVASVFCRDEDEERKDSI